MADLVSGCLPTCFKNLIKRLSAVDDL